MKKDSFAREEPDKGIFFSQNAYWPVTNILRTLLPLYSLTDYRCRYLHIPIVSPFTRGAFSPIRRMMTAAPKAKSTTAK